ncbi:Sas10/Utp3/C1D family-domain-containing protein [Durotheca rogersii]|uniref:Sas10/Utp3/C1D family-domain-containing protein n=1 Tax=Durotheca rogersii TaxID=419775 RepID=UPI00221F5D88|nr:Sas10/Utp3/C1D family-domain-containing protein [Durotheca rogersii]KAI5867432.1 Sas10/Utp3/C1D family-domain-containing protein [Durotheca rogersii]
MEPADITPRLEELDDELDNLEEALQPILHNVSDVASKLPLLDKAKLYVLVTYSIESILFSSLRLNGVNPKEHPVFRELTRVRQYFEKIKDVENPPPKPEKPEKTLNKEAAIRFIRSDLADNKDISTKLNEMIAQERARAALQTAAQAGDKRKAAGSRAPRGGDDNDESSAESAADGKDAEAGEPRGKRRRELRRNGREHESKKSKKLST